MKSGKVSTCVGAPFVNQKARLIIRVYILMIDSFCWDKSSERSFWLKYTVLSTVACRGHSISTLFLTGDGYFELAYATLNWLSLLWSGNRYFKLAIATLNWRFSNLFVVSTWKSPWKKNKNMTEAIKCLGLPLTGYTALYSM